MPEIRKRADAPSAPHHIADAGLDLGDGPGRPRGRATILYLRPRSLPSFAPRRPAVAPAEPGEPRRPCLVAGGVLGDSDAVAEPLSAEACATIHRLVIRSAARRVGLSGADLQDAVAEVLAVIVERKPFGEFDAKRGSEQAYLFGFARNVARALARRERRRRAREVPFWRIEDDGQKLREVQTSKAEAGGDGDDLEDGDE